MAQAAGRGKLADNHPSPDYITGIIQFAGGLRGQIECGAGAPDVPEVDYWWRKNRVGAQGARVDAQDGELVVDDEHLAFGELGGARHPGGWWPSCC